MIDHLSPEAAYERVNKQQKLAAEPGASVWVSANAGSGKTKVLIDRVARLLLSGAEPDGILCITYTKAAASEMQQRLFKRLGSWSVMGDKELAKNLEDLQNEEISQYDTEALKKARALFAKALETPGGLRIETLHAFAGRVLRRFPLEAGVPPGFQELDDTASDVLWERASRTTFIQAFEDENHRETVRHVIREVGGLGRQGVLDKIKNEAGKLLAFLEQYHTPKDIYNALSAALNAPDMSGTEFFTHIMTANLPRAQIERAMDLYMDRGGTNNLAQAERLRATLASTDPVAAFDIYKTVFMTDGGTARKSLFTKALQETLVDDLFNPTTGKETQRFSEALEQYSAIRLRERTLALLTLAAPLMSEHKRLKHLQAGLDFDDLIVETRKLLITPGLAEWVLFKLDGGISHVLLDEAQDTSPDQWEIVNALVTEFFSGSSSNDDIRTQFVVGDEKQSIYSFQGADTAKFQSERQNFAARTALDLENTKFHLPEIEMSFRTTPQVLNFVDAVFNRMTDEGQAPFSNEIPVLVDMMRHHAFRHNQTGSVEVWPLDEKQKTETGVAWHAPMDMERSISPAAALSEKIANWIRARLDGEQAIWSDERKPKPIAPNAGDFLILVRSRGPLFKALIQALKAEGLPVAGADRVTLLDALVIQDLLNLVRFVLCPEDDLVLAEILKGPFLSLLDDDKYLFPIAHGRDDTSLWHALQASDMAEHVEAVQFLNNLIERASMPAFEFLTDALTRHYPANGLTGWQLIDRRFGAPARDPLDALLGIAAGMDDADATSLQRFLNAIEKQDSQIKRELSGPAGEIRVMTVHGAKGLEAPIVILPDTTGVAQDRLTGRLVYTEDGIPVWLDNDKGECPAAAAIRAREKARQVAESNRLLYVALTRARDQLVICGAWRGKDTGNGYTDGSWFDICQQTLPHLQNREDVRTSDDVWSMGQMPVLPLNTAPVSVPEQSNISLPDWVRRPAPEISHAFEQRAPSQLLPGDTPVLPPFGKDHTRRYQRGRLIHALLEILPDVPLNDRETRARTFLTRCLQEEEDELREDIIKTTFGVLNAPDLADIFGPGGQAEAPIVGTGPNLPDGIVINGRIDRMRITDTEVLVIDFKTDRPPPKSEAEVALPYLAQMGAYYDVLSNTYPDKSVKCALLWTHGAYSMVLSEAAMMSALTKSRAKV